MPSVHRDQETMLLFGKGAMKIFISWSLSGIDTIISDHLEVFFWNVLNQPFNELESRHGFSDEFVVFMSMVMESDRVTIIVINTRGSNNRSAKISSDVFGDNIRPAFVRFSIDIEALLAMFVDIGFGLLERMSKSLMEFIEKCSTEGVAHESVVEMFDRAPMYMITGPAFRD